MAIDSVPMLAPQVAVVAVVATTPAVAPNATASERYGHTPPWNQDSMKAIPYGSDANISIDEKVRPPLPLAANSPAPCPP